MKKLSLLLFVAVITAMMLTACDGQSYKEVTIGDQVWMTENLNVEEFRNGDPIPHAQTDEEWKRAGENGQPAWCYYDNDPANGKIYGKLYNFYAVSDWRGLAPEGWRIPDEADWYYLVTLLGGEDFAGGKLKANDTIYWENPNTGATNETGFTALPGGYRYDEGRFDNIGYGGFWWSSAKLHSNSSWYRTLDNRSTHAFRHYANKSAGFSLRLLRE